MNNIVIYFEIFIIFFTGLIIRSFFIYKYGWFGVDTFRSLRYADEIRRNNRKIPEKSFKVIGEGRYCYPPFLPVLLSFFDKRYYKKLQYLSPIVDICSALILLIFCYTLFNNLLIAIFSALLYLFTPLLIYQSVSLTPRQFANLLLISSLIPLYFYFENGGIYLIFISAFLLSFVVLQNRVAVQSAIVILFFEALILKSLVPIGVLLVGLFISIVISKGYAVKVLVEHKRFIQYFLKTGSIYERKRKLTSPRIIITWFPFIILLPVILWKIPYNSSTIFFITWFISVLLLAIFWIGGRGHFHLTNGIFPFAVMTGFYIEKTYYENYLFILLNILTILCIVSLFILVKYSEKIFDKMGNLSSYTVSEDLLDGFHNINKHSKSTEILFTLPGRYCSAAAYFTHNKILGSSGVSVDSIKFESDELVMFNFNNDDFIKMCKKYPFDILLANEEFVNINTLKNIVNEKGVELIYNKNIYYVFRIINSEKFIESILKSPQLSKGIYKPMGY